MPFLYFLYAQKEDEKFNIEDEKHYNKEKQFKYNINPYIFLNSEILSKKLPTIIIVVAIISIIYAFG